ncbi:hypothetical protein [Geobacter sp. SVR]|uniref:hypothetical protein n=1 Tax=Geobacter sp. SVR TaxID=2495594 RepID=UPI00143EFF2B|nr:hypothetical protein [Geobacter sp. SVR]BCS54769.1 hypothetical protein GSVR_30770 [Geobacter sp. SVR]GCF86423.1 hypothetical protein GSbR_30230 [Geobacter sp. SVR]
MKVEKNTSYVFKFMLSSGDGDDYPGCKLTVAFWRWLIVFGLPPIIKPDVFKVRGQYNYDQYIERRYGVYLFENHFNICYGRGDANFHRDEFGPEQRWSCFLPWNELRFVRHSVYGLQGEHVRTLGKGEHTYEMGDVIPRVVFPFRDYDGEALNATTFIEEREWHRGEKWFKWLSLFFKPMIRRSLDIQFSGEIGPRKGSWKGGTIGHSIDLEPGELHESAFRRYCQTHNMTFDT